MQVEDGIDEGFAAVRHREAAAQLAPDGGCPDIAGRSLAIAGAGLRDLVLRPMLLVAAELAAIVQADRHATRPLGLVDRAGAPARGTGRGKELRDGEAEAGVTVRRGRESGERRIEVTQVRRSKDEVREQSGERATLEAERASLSVDRGARDPAAAAVQVGDDVARLRACLEARLEQVGRGRRRKALECRQREPGLGPGEEQPAEPRHRARLWQVDPAATLDR
jgi:hypothetical protein